MDISWLTLHIGWLPFSQIVLWCFLIHTSIQTCSNVSNSQDWVRVLNCFSAKWIIKWFKCFILTLNNITVPFCALYLVLIFYSSLFDLRHLFLKCFWFISGAYGVVLKCRHKVWNMFVIFFTVPVVVLTPILFQQNWINHLGKDNLFCQLYVWDSVFLSEVDEKDFRSGGLWEASAVNGVVF